MSHKHLFPLSQMYAITNVGVTIISFFYSHELIKEIPNHLLLLAIHAYFLISGFTTVYGILKAKGMWMDRIYTASSRVLQFIPIYLVLLPVKTAMTNALYIAGSAVIGEKYAFIQRLFSVLALFMWLLGVDVQATLLLSILLLINSNEYFLTTWCSYIVICIYIQYEMDPFQLMSSSHMSQLDVLPQQSILTYISNNYFPMKDTMAANQCQPDHSNHCIPSDAVGLYLDKRMSPLHCQLPFFLMGGMLASVLYTSRLKAHQQREAIKAQNEHPHIKESYALSQVTGFSLYLVCCWCCWNILFHFDTILSLHSKTYYMHHAFELLCYLLFSCCFSFLLYSCLISKSHPYHNQMTCTGLSIATGYKQDLSAFTSYFFIAHFIICFECIFIFEFNLPQTIQECGMATAYSLVFAYVVSSIMQIWVLRPATILLGMTAAFVDSSLSSLLGIVGIKTR
jgi:hypothetical protein